MTAASTLTAKWSSYFDRHFDLGLSDGERADLVAYLDAVGDAKEPITRNTVQAELDEIGQFVSVLDTAIPERNREVIALTVDAVGNEWRELGRELSGRAGYQRPRRSARTAARARRGARPGADLAAGRHGGGCRRFRRSGPGLCRLPAAGYGGRAGSERRRAMVTVQSAIREAHFNALRQLAELAK